MGDLTACLCHQSAKRFLPSQLLIGVGLRKEAVLSDAQQQEASGKIPDYFCACSHLLNTEHMALGWGRGKEKSQLCGVCLPLGTPADLPLLIEELY